MFIIETIKTKLSRIRCSLPFGITESVGGDGIIATGAE